MVRQLFYSGPLLETLHEEYAKKGLIDEQAPIKTAADLYINAPVERVWEQLLDLARWPKIDPSFRNVRLGSEVAVDARFQFVLHNFPIRAKFAVVNPERELTWTGVSLWFKAIDRYTLEPAQDGGTQLHLAESFAGVLATLLMSSEQLAKQHQTWLAAFKQAVEKDR